MPLKVLALYLESEYIHEMKFENYVANMLLYTARGYVKDPEKLPRYYDWFNNKVKKQKDHTTQDVIDMFKQAGKRKAKRM